MQFMLDLYQDIYLQVLQLSAKLDYLILVQQSYKKQYIFPLLLLKITIFNTKAFSNKLKPKGKHTLGIIETIMHKLLHIVFWEY